MPHGVVARRTGFHAVLELLPSLSRGELLNVAFRVAGLTGPLIEAPQELLLQTKARMQQVLRDRPLAEWRGPGALRDRGEAAGVPRNPGRAARRLSLIHI